MTKKEKESLTKEIKELQEWMKDSCGENVREDAAGDLLDLMLRDAGIVDEFLSSTQDSPPSHADGNFEGVLGVFEMEKRRYRSSICVVS